MFKYIVAGIPRSGSTWMFNCIRLALINKYGVGAVYSGWFDWWDPSFVERHIVLKAHAYEPDLLPGKVFTSWRDLREIAASMVLLGWSKQDTVVQDIESWLSHFLRWKEESVYCMSYLRMLLSPITVAGEILSILDIDMDPNELNIDIKNSDFASPGQKLKVPQGYLINTVTLHHDKHRKGCGGRYYQDMLTPDQILAIEGRFPEWIYG